MSDGVTSWTRHLPAGVDPATIDLTARVSLPAAWAARWRAAPDRPVLRDVDVAEDAEAVAAICAEDSEFRTLWKRLHD